MLRARHHVSRSMFGFFFVFLLVSGAKRTQGGCQWGRRRRPRGGEIEMPQKLIPGLNTIFTHENLSSKFIIFCVFTLAAAQPS